MAKLTLDDLRKLRDTKKREMNQRETDGKTVTVIIGMGTCGIAAGAKETFDAFADEIAKNRLGQVLIKQTGCMGLCYSEPTVEVLMPDMPGIIYGKVDAEVARRIVRQHIIGRTLIDDHIFDKPHADLVPSLTASKKAG